MLLLIISTALFSCSALNIPLLPQRPSILPSRRISNHNSDSNPSLLNKEDIASSLIEGRTNLIHVADMPFKLSLQEESSLSSSFDTSLLTFSCCASPSSSATALLTAFPAPLDFLFGNNNDIREELCEDIALQIARMQSILSNLNKKQNNRIEEKEEKEKEEQLSDLKLTCRLSLITSTKCPKWHEDNVNYRLLKTYMGRGTEYVDTKHTHIRLLNAILCHFDRNLTVFPSFLIHATSPGDVLIMRGKKGVTSSSTVPVLHRSPAECSATYPRLLLTITI